MPNAPSDPAETARVHVETAHRVLDQAHPVREMTVRVVPRATARRVTVLSVQMATGRIVRAANVVRTVTDLREIGHPARTVTVLPAMESVVRTVIVPSVMAENAVITGIVLRETARIVVTVPLVMEKSVSGSLVRAVTASLTVTASHMATVPNVTAIGSHMVTDLSAQVLLAATVPVSHHAMEVVTVSVTESVASGSPVKVANAVNTSLGRVTSVASGSPVKVGTANRLVTAPMVTAHAAMKANVVPTVSAHNVATGHHETVAVTEVVTVSVASGSRAKAVTVVVTKIVRNVMEIADRMVTGPPVMANVVRMVTGPSTVTVRDRMIAENAMSAPN